MMEVLYGPMVLTGSGKLVIVVVAVTSVSLTVLGVGELVVMLDGTIAVLVLGDEVPVGIVLVATVVVVVV